MTANNQPAEEIEAILRRNFGLDRILQRDRSVPPHPRHGGSRGYPVCFRQEQFARTTAGLPTIVCAPSIRRWQEQLVPYRKTGNKENENLRRFHQILFSLCIFAFPEATTDEIATFIANSGGDGGRVYSHQAIYTRVKQLKLTMKKLELKLDTILTTLVHTMKKSEYAGFDFGQ